MAWECNIHQIGEYVVLGLIKFSFRNRLGHWNPVTYVVRSLKKTTEMNETKT